MVQGQSVINFPDPINPYLKRWMVFVDGENITIRGQELIKGKDIDMSTDQLYQPDIFMWFDSHRPATAALERHLRHLRLQPVAERAFYYTSAYGDDQKLFQIREALWELGFTPEVFKKTNKRIKAKGVDIALTKDLLSNAFLDNYDVAVILTGDADYRPVINELKRLGKTVCLMSFIDDNATVQPELKLSADYFVPLNDIFFRGRMMATALKRIKEKDENQKTSG